MQKHKTSGFSLLEVTIVMALSLVLVGMVAGIYSLRKGIETDDALKQISSVIQTVRNDAQKGLGPTTDVEREIIDSKPSSELFGQALGFGNNCYDIPSDPRLTNPSNRTGKSCIYVIKLAREIGNNNIFSYGLYKIDVPYNMAFNLINQGDNNLCNTYLSCYTKPQPFGYNNLSTSPISSSVNGDPVGIVVRNGSGAMYAFNGNLATLGVAADLSNYDGQQAADRQGILRLVVAQLADKSDNELTTSSTWDVANPRYFLSIDLTGRNTTTIKRGNQFK